MIQAVWWILCIWVFVFALFCFFAKLFNIFPNTSLLLCIQWHIAVKTLRSYKITLILVWGRSAFPLSTLTIWQLSMTTAAIPTWQLKLIKWCLHTILAGLGVTSRVYKTLHICNCKGLPNTWMNQVWRFSPFHLLSGLQPGWGPDICWGGQTTFYGLCRHAKSKYTQILKVPRRILFQWCL